MDGQVMGGNFNCLIVPGIYTRVHVWMFRYPHFVSFALTVLYSHNRHAIVTSDKVVVNIRCSKKWRSFICAISAQFVRQEQSSHNAYDISEHDNISSRHPHQLISTQHIKLKITKFNLYTIRVTYNIKTTNFQSVDLFIKITELNNVL